MKKANPKKNHAESRRFGGSATNHFISNINLYIPASDWDNSNEDIVKAFELFAFNYKFIETNQNMTTDTTNVLNVYRSVFLCNNTDHHFN